jgi:hypothetical protein
VGSFVDLLCILYTVQKGVKDIGYQVSFSSTEGLEIFSSPYHYTKVLGPTQPPVKHATCILLKGKAARRDFNHPPSSRTDAQTGYRGVSTPLYAFQVWYKGRLPPDFLRYL